MTDHYDAYQSGYIDGFNDGSRQHWHNLEEDPTDLPEPGRQIEVVIRLGEDKHDQYRLSSQTRLPSNAIRWMYVPVWKPSTN